MAKVNLRPKKVFVPHTPHHWHSGSGATEAIAPVPLFQGGAPLQFLFHLFLVTFAYILQKLTLDLNYYWQNRMLYSLNKLLWL